MENESPKTNKNIGFIKEIISFAILAIVIVIPVRIFIAQPFIVSGESMYSTFETGQYLIVDQLSYRFHEPQRGDVIIFRFPENPSKFFIKRIIGLPRETIQLEGNDVYITTTNGERIKLEENYTSSKRDTFQTTELSDTEYFVMGDNRLASLDSRSWGPLEEHFIIGRAFVRLLPINTFDFLPGQDN
ncbi:signal peptidase I [Candidatus Nomurabacteria bacterium]|nr:signal peptidase I [Candidatus Nomurabacteria bacterium]